MQATSFPMAPLRESSQVREGVFRFLNVVRSSMLAGDWNDPSSERLWLYNLHYFNDLNAVDRGARAEAHRRLLIRWVAENPPGKGTGWEPYPLSLRIVNWIKWTCSGFALPDSALHSLAIQARYLGKRLEYHLLGNHLLADAKALVFAGLFFEGRESREWLDTGLRILERELTEQVLADGGHFERSPMYHSIILEDLLDLLAISRVFPSGVSQALRDAWAETAERMFSWLAAMCHPDGEISFFNDAAFGTALPPAHLRACAEALDIRPGARSGEDLLRLEPSGYVRLREGHWSLIFDAAPVGPDYMPGHAHADTLSFELCWDAQRVLTNSGTSTYAKGPKRAWERSTAAHNTVEIDGESSSEVWDAFRVARRARPFAQDAGKSDGMLYVAASHDGYGRLKGSPVHRRVIEAGNGALRVRDSISGRGVHSVAGYFHLHPAIRIEEATNGGWRIFLPQGTVLRMDGRDGLCLRREEGTYAPEFGRSTTRPVLAWRIVGRVPLSAAVEITEERR